MPAMIVLGDKTDHGGEVIEASGVTDTHGKRIARVGDKVYCPKKGHGTTVITTGDNTMIIDGKAVSYHGCKTSCGATLISSQAVTTVNFGSGGSASASMSIAMGAASQSGQASAASKASQAEQTEQADQRFLLLDESTKEPLANRLYRLKFRGSSTEGRTDTDGRTSAVVGSVGEEVEIEVFAEQAGG
ncbi:MAG: PAAR domain-containing protein [Rhizobacter sp.]|nr:PAAR domain-containing protein [Rhizobacter sp.]